MRRTVARYRSALQRHYLVFIEQPEIARAYPYVARVDREFQLSFAAYLRTKTIFPNGHPNSRPRPIKAPDFVSDVVRGMLAWAADPHQAHCCRKDFTTHSPAEGIAVGCRHLPRLTLRTSPCPWLPTSCGSATPISCGFLCPWCCMAFGPTNPVGCSMNISTPVGCASDVHRIWHTRQRGDGRSVCRCFRALKHSLRCSRLGRWMD